MRSAPVPVGEGAGAALAGLGVPGPSARRWSRVGGIARATVWISGGAAVHEVHRPLSAHLRIAGWAPLVGSGTADAAGALAGIIRAIVDEAGRRGLPMVKAQTQGDEDPLAGALVAEGFTRMPGGGDPLSGAPPAEFAHERTVGWIRWLAPGPPVAPAPAYERQKTEFTCGPACALMALGRGGTAPPRGLDAEMEIWREATYTVGVGHFGLAGAIARRGARVHVITSSPGPVVGVSRAHMATGHVREAIHRKHVDQARALGVTWEYREPAPQDLARALAAGRRVVVLVDLASLNGETMPHWILAWGAVGDHVLVHDPWTDEQFGESWVETDTLALRGQDLWDAGVWTEEEGNRAVLVIGHSA